MKKIIITAILTLMVAASLVGCRNNNVEEGKNTKLDTSINVIKNTKTQSLTNKNSQYHSVKLEKNNVDYINCKNKYQFEGHSLSNEIMYHLEGHSLVNETIYHLEGHSLVNETMYHLEGHSLHNENLYHFEGHAFTDKLY